MWEKIRITDNTRGTLFEERQDEALACERKEKNEHCVGVIPVLSTRIRKLVFVPSSVHLSSLIKRFLEIVPGCPVLPQQNVGSMRCACPTRLCTCFLRTRVNT